jgi:2-(1,2-epoxy-1,2-dihydrophenyl)acetyl-CoA isomerase
MSDQLLTVVDGPVARITVNRPEARNATSYAMLAQMREFLKQVEHDPDVRCIVLTGTGGHFMAGADLSAFTDVLQQPAAERQRQFEERVHQCASLFLTIERLPQPFVTAVRGAVAGAGMGFVASSDFVIASENSLFVMAHVHIGASADASSTYYLPRVVGLRKAKELAMLGERVPAQQALAMDLVNRVVPDSELEAETGKLVERLVNSPSRALERVKRMMNESLGNTLARQLQMEADSFGTCAATEDFVEGVSAFMQKRKPAFRGR